MTELHVSRAVAQDGLVGLLRPEWQGAPRLRRLSAGALRERWLRACGGSMTAASEDSGADEPTHAIRSV